MSVIEHNLKISRQFQWTSSVSGEPQALAYLNERMTWFYGQVDGRELYQTMLDGQEANIPQDSPMQLVPRYIADARPDKVLEIGCGEGRLYRQLRRYGFEGHYTGLEVAEYVTERNKENHPEANWQAALAYDIPFPAASFDMCFSTYVLEHFVYPERALLEMLRILKPGGKLVLVFPDFVASGRFASQLLGFSIGRFSEKLSQRRWLDALVSLYDSRFRLPSHLKTAAAKSGPFCVNLSPVCLHFPDTMAPDVDAVYISSKAEIHDWANQQGCHVDYPCGKEGCFKVHSFMVLIKP